MKYIVKNTKSLTGGLIWSFKKSPKVKILSHSLTDHSCKPRARVHSHHFTPQQQTQQWDVPFGIPMSEGPLHLIGSFYLPLGSSSSCSKTIPMFQLTLSLSSVSECTTSILKCFHYYRGIGQVQI